MKLLAVIAALAFVAGCQASATPGSVASAAANSAASTSADATAGAAAPGAGSPTPPTASAGAPTGTIYRIGQEFAAGPFELTVVEAKQIASLGNFQGQYKPAAGNVFFEARISMESNAAGSYSDLDFTVEDTIGASYPNNQKNSQALGSGSLPVGRLATGWVSFEVPAALAGKLTLVYSAPPVPPIHIRLY